MLTGIVEVNVGVLSDLIDQTIEAGGNIMTFGPAGCGKTEIAMQRAIAKGYETVYLNLSVLEAPDLLGLPMIDEKTKTSTYAPPSMIPLLKNDITDGKPIVLLVDEVDKAKPELQNPMLELFQFRSMNGRKMNIHSIIATGNLPDENAHSQTVSHALTNRCSVYRTCPDFEAWQSWATSAGINPLIIGFLSKNQHYLLQPAPSGDDTAYCHPSPRSWSLAARDLDHTDSEKHSVEFQHLLVAGRVGAEAAIKFKVWLEHFRFIEPYVDDLLKTGKHPSGEAIRDPARTIVCAIAAVNGIVQACNSQESSRDKKEKALEKTIKNVCGWLEGIPSEISICAFKSCLNMKMLQDHKLVRYPDFIKIADLIRVALKE